MSTRKLTDVSRFSVRPCRTMYNVYIFSAGWLHTCSLTFTGQTRKLCRPRSSLHDRQRSQPAERARTLSFLRRYPRRSHRRPLEEDRRTCTKTKGKVSLTGNATIVGNMATRPGIAVLPKSRVALRAYRTLGHNCVSFKLN